MKTLNLAAVQMESANNRVAENLARAAQWVDAAARGKAELVLLPELFSTGYDVNANIWRAAEPEGGATEDWLCATGRRHGIHVGGSYLEHQEGRYFNTFALAGPSGEMVGRVRKEHPCSFEAYIFEGGDGLHISFTHLADSDGREVARVPQGEGVAAATVRLDPARKRRAMGSAQDRFRPWVVKVPSEYGAFHYFETWGRRWYQKHASLRQLAPSQPPLP